MPSTRNPFGLHQPKHRAQSTSATHAQRPAQLTRCRPTGPYRLSGCKARAPFCHLTPDITLPKRFIGLSPGSVRSQCMVRIDSFRFRRWSDASDARLHGPVGAPSETERIDAGLGEGASDAGQTIVGDGSIRSSGLKSPSKSGLTTVVAQGRAQGLTSGSSCSWGNRSRCPSREL